MGHYAAELGEYESWDTPKRTPRESARLRVYNYIEGKKNLGATCDEVEEALGLTHQNASARINDLKGPKMMWIVDSGLKRKTRSGSKATVWISIHFQE